VCKCGCGQKVKWSAGEKCFRDYAAGHQSRVHNNWGHNPTAIEKSSQTRREQFARGERTVWNRGLTESSDSRISNNLINLKKTVRSESHRKIKSEEMKRNRLNGTVPTLERENHPNWKGGVSTVNQICRADHRLFTEWTYPILLRDGFKCVQCGSTKDLQVHHDVELFSDILKKLITLEDLELQEDFERKKLICEKVTNYHINNKVSGKTLCFNCHKEIHPSLNLV
jgi:hypothetical protein